MVVYKVKFINEVTRVGSNPMRPLFFQEESKIQVGRRKTTYGYQERAASQAEEQQEIALSLSQSASWRPRLKT